jgi:hypothetical protein
VIDIREDSSDLTDEEVASAVPVTEMPVRDGPCPTCGEPVQRVEHWLRRRRPHLYARLSRMCNQGHVTTEVFRLDHMREAP